MNNLSLNKVIAFGITLSIFLAYFQMWEIIQSFEGNLKLNIDATFGVLNGEPNIRIFQNRILGPYLFKFIMQVSGSGAFMSFLLTIFLLSFLMYFLLLLCSYDITKSLSFASGVIFAAATLSTIFMQGKWIYLWDFIDFIIVTLIIWSWVSKKSILFISFIAFIGFFNRELTLIILSWMICLAVINLTILKKNITNDDIDRYKKIFFSSFFLLIVGIFLIEFLRTHFLINPVGSELYKDIIDANANYQFKLIENIDRLWETIESLLVLKFTKFQIYNFSIFFSFFIFLLGIKVKNKSISELSGLALMMLASTIFFGNIYESRVWISFTPLIITIYLGVLNASKIRKL